MNLLLPMKLYQYHHSFLQLFFWVCFFCLGIFPDRPIGVNSHVLSPFISYSQLFLWWVINYVCVLRLSLSPHRPYTWELQTSRSVAFTTLPLETISSAAISRIRSFFHSSVVYYPSATLNLPCMLCLHLSILQLSSHCYD